jgi:hypothetical protein
MTRVAILAAALFSVGSGLSFARAGQGSQDYTDPMVAAFGALIKESRSGLEAGRFCVGTAPFGYIRGERSDPSPEVVSRLSAAHANLYAASKCKTRQAAPTDRLLEDSTGRQLMFVTLSCSHRLEGDTLVFQGAYHCGWLCGGGGTVRVWRAGGAWQARLVLEWMS